MANGQPVAPVHTIDDVWEAYHDDLQEVEAQIRVVLDSPSPLIKQMSLHIMNGGGKRVRPLLLILCANLSGYLSPKHLILGSFIECIHTATLLHDDVLDEADLRRGRPTARCIWGNHASILVGDYLYSLAMGEIAAFQNHALNGVMSEACRKMTEGEILQLGAKGNSALTEDEYLRIIEYKTGALIAAACKAGAIVGGASPERQAALYRFGLHLGMAFQLVDDRLDYIANGNRLGKTLGQDIKQGMITLPLLYLLQHCSAGEKARVVQHIASRSIEDAELEAVIALMHEYGAMAYAGRRAQEFIDAANLDLELFEDSVAKRSLAIVARYMITRDQ